MDRILCSHSDTWENLGKLGKNAIVRPSVRFRYAAQVGDHCIIDDGVYFSCRLIMGDYSHISHGCTFLGGGELVVLGRFVDIAPGCRICAASSDYRGDRGVTVPTVEGRVRGDRSPILILDHAIVGANTVILPGALIPQGAVIGALSLVRGVDVIERWGVYAGVPVRKIGERRSDLVLEQAKEIMHG